MYWLRGEGLGDVVYATLLERSLGVDAAIGVGYLDRLVDDGYLDAVPDGYVLSDVGLAEGRTEFALSFACMNRPDEGGEWLHVLAGSLAEVARLESTGVGTRRSLSLLRSPARRREDRSRPRGRLREDDDQRQPRADRRPGGGRSRGPDADATPTSRRRSACRPLRPLRPRWWPRPRVPGLPVPRRDRTARARRRIP
jgi:hypothetical protein